MNDIKTLSNKNKLETIKNLEQFLCNVDKLLKINEDLILTLVMRKKIPKPYYNTWIKEVNGYFPVGVVLKRRLKKYQNQNETNN